MPTNRVPLVLSSSGPPVTTMPAGDTLAVPGSLTTTGSVGVGTTTPFTALHVYKNIPGAGPASTGVTDANVVSRVQGGSVVLDVGVRANGNTWQQVRSSTNLATNYPLELNPNGGGVYIGGDSTSKVTFSNTGNSTTSKLETGAGYMTIGTTSADPLVFATNNTEVGRFNSYGGLNVISDLSTNTNLLVKGGTVQVNGTGACQYITNKTDNATDAKFSRHYGTNNALVFDFPNDPFNAATTWCIVTRNGTQPTSINYGTGLYPLADNTYSLGNSSVRWSAIYLANNPIVGSDQRIKGVPRDLDDEFLNAWGRVRWRVFQYLDAIAKKGEEWARWNLGAIAQEVRDDLLAGGVDGRRYGILCYDQWDAIEHIEQPFVPAVPAKPAFEGIARTIDDEGNVTDWLSPPREAVPEVPAVPASVLQQGREAGDLWSLRYTQMLVAEAAWSRREHASATARADATDARLAALEAKPEAPRP